ncbi:unnamed protein product [Orchesella dallaii]|uniref:Secreted protein n=1 Tax=Orchesella dallaii TaxID=48710 RepID=A0ABP1S8F7_9HEXA
MGRNRLFYAAVGGILFISLGIANGQDCAQAPWGKGEPKCPNSGQELIYWFTDSDGDSSGWCCVPDSAGGW